MSAPPGENESGPIWFLEELLWGWFGWWAPITVWAIVIVLALVVAVADKVTKWRDRSR